MRNYFKRLKAHPGVPVAKHETTAAFVRDFARAVLAKWGAPQPLDCHHRPPCDECAAYDAQGGK